MRILMISLDKKILDKGSAVARRMIEYGEKDELFILIPHHVRQKFDLSPRVHVQTTGGNKIAQFARLKRIGVQIVKEHRVEQVTTQDPFFSGLAGAWLKNTFGVQLEVQLHGDFFGSDYYRKSGVMNLIRYQVGKIVVKRADRVRVVGERIKENLTKLYKIKGDAIEVRPIAVDADRIRVYIPKMDLHKKYVGFEKIFLALGRIEPVKNIAWLVDVFADVVKQKPNCLLLVVGSGSEEDKMRLQVTDDKLQKNIQFEGWTDDPWSYLKTADCLLFPSLAEGYGLVAMEAVAAGRPVIMTDVGVANYELKPSKTVRIVPVGDREAFIRAMLDL